MRRHCTISSDSVHALLLDLTATTVPCTMVGVTKGSFCLLTIPFCIAATLASASWRACLYIIDMHLQGGFLLTMYGAEGG